MGKIIVVTSGKGGVGKSTVSALLGYFLKKNGKKTIIIELDMGLRSLDIMMGTEDEISYDLSDILSGACEPYKAIRTAEKFGGLQFIPAPGTVTSSLDTERFVALCIALKKNYDYVLVDSPAGIGELFRIALRAADEALIVTTPDMVCMRDAANVSFILEEEGLSRQKLLINKLSKSAFKKSGIRDLDEIIDVVGVQLVGVAEQSDAVSDLSASGKLSSDDLDVMKEFSNIAKRICGEDVPLHIYKY
ncbi:MAG: AAA family ATPase [Oscillospiraceae bacterium]|nr:AAA family ATPase [Oscillospiraceae bacterium]